MTYREIFLQAVSHAVNDTIGVQEVEIKGRKMPLNTQQAFDICKGFKFFAQGENFNESSEIAFEKTIKANPRLTPKLARVLMTGITGYLRTALDALGFNQNSNLNETIREWFDQTISPANSIDVNCFAANII